MKKTTLLLTLSLLVFVFSCKDEDTFTNQTGIYSSNDFFMIQEGVSSAEMAISNIVHIIELAIDEEEVFYSNGITYPVITKEKLDPNQISDYPMILNLDFGEDTIQGYDNRYRAGKITANISAYWKDSLSLIEADIQNYYMATHTPNYIDGIKKEYISSCGANLRLKIRNEGLTKKLENIYYPTQFISTDSAHFSTSLGDIIVSSQRYTFYYSGYDTPEYGDDKTHILLESGGRAYDKKNNNWDWTSGMLGSSDEGLNYFSYNRNCFWLVSGNFKLKYKNLKTDREYVNIIDFGKMDQTNCDNIASYSTNGLSIVFNLP